MYDPKEIGIVFSMDKKELISYLEQIDQRLNGPTSLCVYGSAAFILLDEPDRTSLGIDVAGPYSQADLGELRQAAERAGLPFNPEESSRSGHLEWIPGLRLCLAAPQPESEILLWSGRYLTVKLAFFPPRLNELWNKIRDRKIKNLEETAELLDTALLLHGALPETGYPSQRALLRLARYQAQARAFGMVRFLRSIRSQLGPVKPMPAVVPGKLVRDIGLPPFDRSFLER